MKHFLDFSDLIIKSSEELVDLHRVLLQQNYEMATRHLERVMAPLLLLQGCMAEAMSSVKPEDGVENHRGKLMTSPSLVEPTDWSA